MATGIVSTAMHNVALHDVANVSPHGDLARWISLVLFVIALAGYAVLVVTVILGAVVRGDMSADLRSGGFTIVAFVAASGVLAARFVAAEELSAATVFAYVAVISWLILGYTAVGFMVTTAASAFAATSRSGPDNQNASPRTASSWTRVNGTWFLLVVSTQSVAVSFGALAGARHIDGYAVVAALWWGLGVLELIIMATLVSIRLLIVGLSATDEVAPYWVFMGAGAISVLGGGQVLGAGGLQTLVARPVVGTVCVMLWAFGSWLVPLLIALMAWYAFGRDPGKGFRSALWSMVFPIGMYGVATRQLGVAWKVSWLKDLGTWEAWVALVVWLWVFVAMLVWAWRYMRRSARAHQPA